jgi:8-oxo-dGTP pyrophosphatase MutT (NUDIX family)
MAHIHTDHGQHDFTASAYIIRTDLPEPAVLLHEHRLLHQWLQFGGHVELNESPWQTVCREIREESGYDPAQLQLLQPRVRLQQSENAVVHPQPVALITHQFGNEPGKHFHNDVGFAFVTSKQPANTVGEGETDNMRAFTRAEIVALPKGTIPENVRDTALIVLDHYFKDWHPVALPDWR